MSDKACGMCAAPTFARWYYDRSGFVGELCEGHLNIWLDNADNEPWLEPTRLEFVS